MRYSEQTETYLLFQLRLVCLIHLFIPGAGCLVIGQEMNQSADFIFLHTYRMPGALCGICESEAVRGENRDL